MNFYSGTVVLDPASLLPCLKNPTDCYLTERHQQNNKPEKYKAVFTELHSSASPAFFAIPENASDPSRTLPSSALGTPDPTS